MMRRLMTLVALVVALALPAWADALSDLRKQAEQGDPEAQFVLGTMYRDGQGVEQDLEETLRWWEKAAELGYVDAQFALGNIHSGGYGVIKNYLLSYMWFDITAERSDSALLKPIALSNRDALVPRMTADEIAEAKRMSVEWLAKHEP